MINIGILIFPQVEELDFVGPFEVLSYVNKVQPDSTKVQLIAETLSPVHAFNGMKIIPDIALQDCPLLDIIIVPGGKGRLSAMKNPVIKEFILQQSKTVRYMASVCTGAFLLAEAGLLTGKKATTYHTAFTELESYSVQVIPSKVVRDGKVITSGGVSSGLELGFYLLKELFGTSISQEVANKIEYEIDVNTL
ncbi:MAG: Isonitrile hydratase [Anaerosporomusa subterranea]|jgi:cyclohexyl-isocyanide hydratase|nr:Isonitrile hydratase [Anaerosporomusa subterranea]